MVPANSPTAYFPHFANNSADLFLLTHKLKLAKSEKYVVGAGIKRRLIILKWLEFHTLYLKSPIKSLIEFFLDFSNEKILFLLNLHFNYIYIIDRKFL